MVVLEVTPDRFLLIERASGVSVDDIRTAIEVRLVVQGEVPEMEI